VEPGTTPRPTCIAASDSIVAWWPLDRLGSGAEEIVNGNQGDYAGNPRETEGKVGGALGFDGVDDLISVPDPGANWILDISNDITLEAWIKRDSEQPAQQVFVGKSGCYYIGCRGGHIFALVSNAFDITGPTLLSVGVWYHLALTYDVGGSLACIYLNGEIDTRHSTGGQSVPIGNGYVYIGGLSGQQYFDGVVDEVSIYNKALSAAEIRTIYNRGALGKCKQ